MSRIVSQIFSGKIKALAITLGFLTLVAGLTPYFIPQAKGVVCPDHVLSSFEGKKDSISCRLDAASRYWVVSSVDSKTRLWNPLKLKPESFPNGARVEAFSETNTPLYYSIGGNDPVIPTIFSTTPQGNNVIVRGFVSVQDIKSGFTIMPYYHVGGAIVFRAIPLSTGEATTTKEFVPAVEAGAPRNWLFLLVGLSLIFGTLTIVLYAKSGQKRWGLIAISLGFLLGHLNFEGVYRGMGGYLDAGDDTYYLAYAQSHLQDRNIFKCDSEIEYSAMSHVRCRNLPGISYLLELGILFESVFNPDIGFYGAIGIHKLRTMRVTSAFFGFLSCLLMFLILHQFGTSALNIVFAIALLWASPLSRFTFERSIFTHTAELCLLTAILLCLALEYRRKIPISICTILCAICMAILINVRGEYWIALAILVPLYLGLKGLNRKRFAILPSAMNVLIYFAAVSPGVIFYFYFARKANLDYATSSGIILNKFSDIVTASFLSQALINISSVVESFWDAGLLIFMGAAATLTSIFHSKTRNPFVWAALIFVGIYFPVLSLYHTPLGYDWQHRYFIKFYPFAFIAIIMQYNHSEFKYKSFVWLITIFSFIKEYAQDQISRMDSALRYEPAKRVLTDTHLLYFGHHYEYFRIYSLAIFLVTMGCFISVLLAIVRIVRGWRFHNAAK